MLVEPSISEADLRRATSDLYFALFHCICEALVEPIGGDAESDAFREVFVTLYRLPDHQFAEKRCKEVASHNFSEPVRRLAQQVVAFKNKRHKADYDPLAVFKRSTVEADIALVAEIVNAFRDADPVEKARFAYFVSIKGRAGGMDKT